MRRIDNREAPSVLREYQAHRARDWSALSTEDKATIRRALAAEQRGLCAYCMGRVKLERDGTPSGDTKIEHVVPRSTGERVFDWNNIVLCCDGNEGSPRSEQTCDTHKGDTALEALDVLDPQDIRYGFAEGTVRSSRADVDRDLHEVLNLNAPRLQANRRWTIGAVARHIQRQKWPRDDVKKAQKALRHQHAHTTLPPYFGMVEQYLERLLRSRSD